MKLLTTLSTLILLPLFVFAGSGQQDTPEVATLRERLAKCQTIDVENAKMCVNAVSSDTEILMERVYKAFRLQLRTEAEKEKSEQGTDLKTQLLGLLGIYQGTWVDFREARCMFKVGEAIGKVRENLVYANCIANQNMDRINYFANPQE